MNDYSDLINHLRDASKMSAALAVILPNSDGNAMVRLLEEAADAIEELLDSYRTAEEAGVYLLKANEGMKRKNEWLHAELVKALESKPKWIPVTERLPDGRHDVLVYAGVLFTYIAVGYYDGLWKFSFDDSEIAGGVDYWMPLPEPPKEES